jgi:DNA repair protein RAD16
VDITPGTIEVIMVSNVSILYWKANIFHAMNFSTCYSYISEDSLPLLMSDIPANLRLDQCLGASYANFPRIASDALYDAVLKAFITGANVVPAEKARREKIKQTKPKKVTKKNNEGETPSESPITTSDPLQEPRDKRFLCERAKSAQSRCRKCGQGIDRNSLRFGYPSPDPRGEFGAIPIWFHIRCTPVEFLGFVKFDEVLTGACFGFSELSPEEQDEVREHGGKPSLPRVILNDEDADYADDFEAPADFSDRLVHRRGISVPLLDPPVEITGATLLPFQREGYSWMVAQESNPNIRGGILADEMGMGKTLQTIALIVAKRSEVRPTLVVAPVAAVMQWYSEIEKFTGAAGSESPLLSVHVYHGAQKISAQELAKFDIVLTTYQTLENDYRKEANKAKVKCKYCKKMFLPGKLSFHLKYMCGPDAMRTMRQSLRVIKDSAAAESAKKTMGIGGSSTAPPTLSNVLRDIVRESGLVGDDQLDGMTQYDLMRLYRDAKVDDVKDEKKVEDESSDDTPKTILSEAELKKLSVAHLKEQLRLHQVDGWSRMKKPEAIAVILEKGLAVSVAPKGRNESPAPPAKRAKKAVVEEEESDSSDVSSSSVSSAPRKRKPVRPVKASPIAPRRRASASKALSAFKAESSDSESSGSSSEFEVDTDSSLDSASSLTESEVEVDTDSEEVSEEEPVVKKGRGSSKKNLVVNRPVQRRVKRDGEESPSSSEDEVEDIDLNHSPLHCVRWGRLVLDEAHRIKQRTNSTSLAAFALSADFRWCLSGTPLQNRVGELYSLVRFLRFSPFAHYFCKGCDCKSLHFRFIDNKFCQKCGCARTKHYSYFKQVISTPIVKFGIGDGVALNVLKNQVLDTILLRRTKLERQSDLNLPSMTVEIQKIQMQQDELDFYESLYKQSMLKFDTFAKSGTLLHNYAHIFDLLTRLRQALDHPYLIVYGADYTVPTAADEKDSAGICTLCSDDIESHESAAIANCGHKFHMDCAKEYIRESPVLPSGGTGCPVCYVPLTIKFDEDEGEEGQTRASTPNEDDEEEEVVQKPPHVYHSIMDRIKASNFKSSTKIEAVVSGILAMPAGSKCLIFSQFTRMLDLVDFRLKQSGIGCAKLTGSQSLVQRSNIIQSFNTDPSLRSLLISLKAGGEGLNLQAADYVFLIDPWWNPASEMQAVQRAHRIGQTKPVKAVRFVTENSVEEKVIALQDMKHLVFEATVGQSQGAAQKLTESDLRFLFNH